MVVIICVMYIEGQCRALGIGLYCFPLTALRQDLSLKQKSVSFASQ